jgi:serine/threonine protein kinase/Tol biopolymer transport system component
LAFAGFSVGFMRTDMTLPGGARLGPYEILSLIGAGGMGQVYKARDTRLNRVVAVKLLATDSAERPDRRHRLEIEAHAISSLNHPHICTLFDVGEHDDRIFIVMEYVDGETLDDRLTKGSLQADDVLRFGGQIAGALDCAHREHIVHRDLKPSNVMLTRSGAKLLDFGLARAPLVESKGLLSTASFDHRRATAEGTIIGTVQYMAPEQLEGKEADARTDIFAFGTLLYEMATGRKAFDGDSQASIIASILTAHPPAISAARQGPPHNGLLPQSLDYLAERCLAKNPDERWQTARDLKAAIDWLADGRDPERVGLTQLRSRRAMRAVGWSAVALLIVGLALLGAILLKPKPPAEITRFAVEFPPGTTVAGARAETRMAVSPDGRHLAIIATTEGTERLWVHSFDSLKPRFLAGTEGASSPFWSPDSRFIGFFAAREGRLKKVELSGGPTHLICSGSVSGLSAWLPDGTILFSEFRKGLFRVSADGGAPTEITRVDPKRGELNHYWPSALPNGRQFLYTVTWLGEDGRRATPIIYVGSLDSNERKEIARLNSRVVYSPSGHVLYVHEGALLAQRFDVDNLRTTGEPMRIADDLDYYRSTGAAGFSMSETTLVYRGAAGPLELVWFDRQGQTLPAIWKDQRFGNLRISPHGEQAAIEVVDPHLGTSDLWMYHFIRGVANRFTADVNDETMPVWSADGGRIIFGSDRGTGKDASSDFFTKSSDGMGSEDVLFIQTGFQTPDDWSRDGNWLSYTDDNRQTGNDVWTLSLTAERKAQPLFNTAFGEWGSRFSPDSHWIAYVSDESGHPEISIAPFQRPGAKVRVSTGGGLAPRWRADGRELFYVTADGKAVMMVPIQYTPVFTPGMPVKLFTINRETGFRNRARNLGYDVSPDGQRFLISVAPGDRQRETAQIIVVQNWTSQLNK